MPKEVLEQMSGIAAYLQRRDNPLRCRSAVSCRPPGVPLAAELALREPQMPGLDRPVVGAVEPLGRRNERGEAALRWYGGSTP